MAEMNVTGINLIDLLKRREPQAISLLYDQYAPALYGAIFRIVKSHTAAEAILEQTFLRIIEEIDTIKNSTSLFTAMYSMARTKACKNALISTLSKIDPEINSDDQTQAVNYLELTEGMESQCGEVVRHLYVEGHSLTQTSEALDLSADKVKTQLRSGMAYIQRKMSGSQKTTLGMVIIISLLIQF